MNSEHKYKTWIDGITISLLLYIAFIKGSQIDPLKALFKKDNASLKSETSNTPVKKDGKNGNVE